MTIANQDIAKHFLAGIVVLDLSQYIPGPVATLCLADFGAQVIKVEPPSGDPMANLGPRDQHGAPIYYQALNAGKTLLRLNLKAADEHAAFLELVRGADVVVEGFRPGVLQRLGIDYPTLEQINPGLVLCSISGYGATSRAAQKAGHDANYLAQGGVLQRNGAAQPMFFDPPLADMAGALYAATAILAALHGRTRTGRGCAIDIALSDTVMPLQILQVADFGATGRVEVAGQSYLNGGAAYYNVYACADGRHIVLGAVEHKFWLNFCQAANRPDWIERHTEPHPQQALTADLQDYFSSQTTDACLARFGAVDCCLSLVNTLDEALGSDQLADRGLVRRGQDGTLQALFPAAFNGVPPSTRSALTPHELPTAEQGWGVSSSPELSKKRPI